MGQGFRRGRGEIPKANENKKNSLKDWGPAPHWSRRTGGIQMQIEAGGRLGEGKMKTLHGLLLDSPWSRRI